MRLFRKSRRTWRSVGFLTALKNTAYGLRAEQTRSRGGSDGVFRLDRDFTPKNPMMTKVFGRFLDRPAARPLAEHLDTTVASLEAVRVVSHHIRLVGVHHSGAHDWLVLIDQDRTKS